MPDDSYDFSENSDIVFDQFEDKGNYDSMRSDKTDLNLLNDEIYSGRLSVFNSKY